MVEQLARGEPATKDDLEAVERRLDTRTDGLATRMDGFDTRMGGLRQYVEELRVTLVERMDALAAVLEGRLEGFEGRLEGVEGRLGATLHRELGAVRTDLAAQTRTFVLAQLGMLITLAALAFAALRIT